MCGTFDSVSTLLTSVGLARPPRPPASRGTRLPAPAVAGREQTVLVGREPPRERRLALDHLEHRLLLAEQVLVGPGDDVDGAVGADARASASPATARVTAAISRSKLRLEADERLVGADREGGDDHALDELVRVGAQQRPVLERAGLALGPVADDVAARAGLGGDSRPLAPRREATAAATPQTGTGDRRRSSPPVRWRCALQTSAASHGLIVLEGADGPVSEQELRHPCHRRRECGPCGPRRGAVRNGTGVSPEVPVRRRRTRDCPAVRAGRGNPAPANLGRCLGAASRRDLAPAGRSILVHVLVRPVHFGPGATPLSHARPVPVPSPTEPAGVAPLAVGVAGPGMARRYDADAVVIGAGPNGLVAANELADAGWSVVVVEGSPARAAPSDRPL